MTSPGADRSCGSCSVCCKVLGIETLGKPQGTWCPRCKIGIGCGDYDNRPQECRTFACLWLTQSFLGPEWKPERAGFVLAAEHGGARLVVYVDPGKPTAWRKEPYFRQIKAWAAAAAARRHQVIVFVNNRAVAVLPDREVDLGLLKPGDKVVSRERHDASGRPVLDVQVLPGSETVRPN
jgi:hypothetical protein